MKAGRAYSAIAILLALTVLPLTGCMTSAVIAKAKELHCTEPSGEVVQLQPERPYLYPVIPFALAGDVVTVPYQAFFVWPYMYK